MPNVGELNVKISLDDSEFQAGLDNVQRQLSSLSDTISKSFHNLTQNITNSFNNLSQNIVSTFNSISTSINNSVTNISNTYINQINTINQALNSVSQNTNNFSNATRRLNSNLSQTSGAVKGNFFNTLGNGLKNAIGGIGGFLNGLRNAVPQVLRLTLAVSGMTYVLGTLRSATSAYINSNAQLQSSVAGCTQALGQALAPAIHLAVGALQILVKWITTAIAYLFTLINVLFGTKLAITTTFKPLEKATAGGSRGMKKLAKDSKKAFSILAPFDELNILDPKNKDKTPEIKTPSSGGAGGGVTPNFADITPRINPEELNKFAEQAKVLWDKIKKPYEDIDTGPAVESLNRLWDSLSRFSEPLGKGLLWFNENVLSKLVKWTTEKLAPVFLDTLAQAFDTLTEAVNALSPGLSILYEKVLVPLASLAGQIVIDFLNGLKQGLKDLTDSGIIKGLGNIFTGLSDIIGIALGQFIADTKELYENLKTLGGWAWQKLVDGLKAIVQDGDKINEKVLKPVADWLENNPWLVKELTRLIWLLVGAWVSWNAQIIIFNALCAINPWTWIVIGIGAVLAVITVLIAYWDDIVKAVKNFFDTCRKNDVYFDWLCEIFEDIIGWIEKADKFIKNFAKGIKDAFSGLGNIIGGIAGSIGGLFGGGGRSIQVNGVPAMASGGVLTSPSLILAGEYSGANTNPEIVSPQSLMYDTVQQALQNNQSYPQDMTISINLGGVEVGREIINLINMTQRNSGETLLEV